MKKRSPKQISRAGMSLSAGFIVLPFIPFKEAKTYTIKPKLTTKKLFDGYNKPKGGK